MRVAPVSDKDLENARRKDATCPDFRIGSVTVLAVVKGEAPSVLAAMSYVRSYSIISPTMTLTITGYEKAK
jgi:hypothetical protein